MCLQGSVTFLPGKNNRKMSVGLEVSEKLNTACKAAAMPDTKMSLRAVGGEMLAWDM